MGLFDAIKGSVKSMVDDAQQTASAELGYQLLCSMGGGAMDEKYAAKVARIKKDLHGERIPILIRAAELVGEPKTLKQLYTVSHAYVWAGATVRTLAIKYTEKYISAGGCWEQTPTGTQNWYGFQRDLRKIAISCEHMALGKLYEAECLFDSAMEQYSLAYQLCPYDAAGVSGMCGVYIKKGDYEGGIALMKAVTKSKYYRVFFKEGVENKDFMEIVDKSYSDLLEKQQKGYVYRPRSK